MNIENIRRPETIYNEEFDINIRPYLTVSEIAEIAEGAMRLDNAIEQEVSIAVNVILTCTDANEEGDVDDMPIDDIMWGGLWAVVSDAVKNLDAIAVYMRYKENAGIAIAKFLNDVLPKFLESIDKDLNKYIKRLPKGKEWDEFVKNVPESLDEILKITKDDGNAEIIRGAAKMGE